MKSEITKLYQLRFNKDIQKRYKIWQILCKYYFQKYIKTSDTIYDVGAGYCEFINNIKAKNKVAIDINPETKKFANKNVKVIITTSTKLPKNLTSKTDVVFVSNFFEHLPTKDDLALTLNEIYRVLKKKGKFIILMPNIRYTGSRYWDFLDHQLPLTDKSMIEALELHNFTILEAKPKFLPYTTKSKYPKFDFVVRLYLMIPLLHTIFGAQSLIVAQK